MRGSPAGLSLNTGRYPVVIEVNSAVGQTDLEATEKSIEATATLLQRGRDPVRAADGRQDVQWVFQERQEDTGRGRVTRVFWNV